MAIHISEGADPLSDAALKSESEGIVRTAQSDAGRVLRQQLVRYCRREVLGRSFLVAGHRGAGKTTMVADALDKALRQSRRPEERMLRPLPIFLHGPSLFEAESAEGEVSGGTDATSTPSGPEGAAEGGSPDAAGADKGAPRAAGRGPSDSAVRSRDASAQARVALKQVILGVHRAVVKEFARAYRERLVDARAVVGQPLGVRRDLAELAAQFEVELAEDPSAERLREFWEMAGALPAGVLFDAPPCFDQGARELVAVNGLCNAHQRISGEMSASDKTARSDDHVSETGSGFGLAGAELVKPLVSVIAGAAVAGAAAAGARHLGAALVAGLLTALGSTAFFKASSTRTRKSGRQTDTTFIPDLSLRTLDRILPTLIQRLREAGLAPMLIVDELDKVPDLSRRFIPMMDFMKKLVAENVFSCFITDRGYLESLRMHGGAAAAAYDRASSYFTHSLLVTHQPGDVDDYLDKLLTADRDPAPSTDESAPDEPYATRSTGSSDVLDLGVLKWMLRHRSQLHALALSREVAALRGDNDTVRMAPGVVRSDYVYRIDVTFQVAIELQLAQPHVQAWLRQRPGLSQTLFDALYYPTRQWLKGGAHLALEPDAEPFASYLVGRMNLDEIGAPSTTQAALEAGALSEDDLGFLRDVVHDVLRFLSDAADATAARTRWDELRRPGAAPHRQPDLPVMQALLLGAQSLATRIVTDEGPAFRWRYWTSGVERREAAGLPSGGVPAIDAASFDLSILDTPGFDLSEALAVASRIERIGDNLGTLMRRDGDAPSTDGSVFELLGDRLRVLPTTPAWSRVRAAIDNLRRFMTGGGNQAPLVEDWHAVDDFLGMLLASTRAVARTFAVAAFCSGMRLDGDLAGSIRAGLATLSSGLDFAGLDALGIERAVERVEADARAMGGDALAALLERIAMRQLDDPALVDDIFQVFKDGHAVATRLPEATMRRLLDAAWDGLRGRLAIFVATERSSPASMAELLCAVRRTGPGAVIGLDLRAVTLMTWTELLVAFVGEKGLAPDQRRMPSWIVGPALNRLGAGNLPLQGTRAWVSWALGPSYAEGVVRNAFDTIAVRPRGEDAAQGRDRIALCVTSGPEAPMGDWTSRPRRGMVFVFPPARLGQMLGQFDLTLQTPRLVAVAQGPDVRIDDETVRATFDRSRAERLVWIARQAFAGMLEPALVGQLQADDVLDYVTSDTTGSNPARPSGLRSGPA